MVVELAVGLLIIEAEQIRARAWRRVLKVDWSVEIKSLEEGGVL
jgi:hypothetical protein